MDGGIIFSIFDTFKYFKHFLTVIEVSWIVVFGAIFIKKTYVVTMNSKWYVSIFTDFYKEVWIGDINHPNSWENARIPQDMHNLIAEKCNLENLLFK